MIPPRPHPFARSRFAELCDRAVATIWEKGWDDQPPLDPDYLWDIGSRGFEQADEVSIRSAEEVADFRQRLERLCLSLRNEAQLNALGHTMAYGQLVSAIRKRHALGRLWRERPDLAQTPIAAPIIVVGQMRSGTTRMQRLLAADPKLSGTRFCDNIDPLPRAPDTSPLRGAAALFMARKLNPWLDAFHPFGVTRTDEEIGWLSASLSPAAFEAQWRIPGFVAFDEEHEADSVYREFARILRTDAAANGNAARPRALKCPQYAQDIPAIIRVIPDAQIVLCTRDRAQVLKSSVSMVASQMAIQSDAGDLDWLQSEWARKFDLRQERFEQFLSGFSGRVSRVDFDELGRDWRAVMAAVYADLGREFGSDARIAMSAEMALSRTGAHRQHRQIMHDCD